MVYGDIYDAFFNSPNLMDIMLRRTRVSGDLEVFEHCHKLRHVALSRTKVHGQSIFIRFAVHSKRPSLIPNRNLYLHVRPAASFKETLMFFIPAKNFVFSRSISAKVSSATEKKLSKSCRCAPSTFEVF
jgi:hypothetical protein